MKLRGPGLLIVPCEAIEGQAPDRVMVLPPHPLDFYHIASGTFVKLTEEDRNEILEHAQRNPAETQIDWRHESLMWAGAFEKGEVGKAYGWIDLKQATDDAKGMWAPVKWTPKGAELVANGEAKYLSPVLVFNYPDAKEGTPCTTIYNVALTNNPNLTDIAPLTKALEKHFTHSEEEPMKDLLKRLIAACEKLGVQLPEGDERTEDSVLAALEAWKPDNPLAALGTAACEALSLKDDDATADNVTAKITELSADRIPELVANALNVKPGDIDGAVKAARKGVASEDLVERLEVLEAEKKAELKTRIDGVIAAAQDQGKVKPERVEYWTKQLEADFDGALLTLSEMGLQVAAMSADLPPVEPSAGTAGDAAFKAWCEAEGIDAETAKTIIDQTRKEVVNHG